MGEPSRAVLLIAWTLEQEAAELPAISRGLTTRGVAEYSIVDAILSSC